MRIALRWFIVSVLCLSHSASSAQAQGSNQTSPTITLTRFLGGFRSPVHITHAGDGSQRLFVLEQEGVIRIVKNQTLVATPFLDIAARVGCCGERGLLSVAFPPNYANKGYFYVNYTNNEGTTVISRYRVTSNPDEANPNSEEVLLTVEQPFSNHNGGQIAFGPDGFLYIGMGDGGSGGDPQNNGQRTDTLLGKLLRIDVESGAKPYAVPATNPFVQNRNYRSEIWALGLRNPWRFSFDRQTGDLYIGDVGQGVYEEIDFQPKASPGGENYGWKIMEGAHCFNSSSCNQSGLTLPLVEYDHSQGCSVTGGVVYRGQQFPRLQGLYFYGDFCSGNLWGHRSTFGSRQNTRLLDTALTISTFGEDEAGEVYVADYGTGDLYRITDPEPVSGADLAVSLADAPDPVTVNSSVTYTATITNNGPSPTENVQLNASLPEGVSFVSASTSQGTCSGTTPVNCQMSRLDPRATATVTLVLKPTNPGGLSLTVSVSGSEPDPGSGNNVATAVTSVSTGSPSPPANAPDFTGFWQSVSQSCKGNGAALRCKLKGSFVVQSQGNQNAPSTSVQFYFSPNTIFESSDTLLSSTTTSAVKAGKSKRRKLSVTLPGGQTATGGFIIAVIDAANSVSERDETNNEISSTVIP
ncbi:MAG: DUF11 domain-containing protein [Deltaproteobacteria bacterium]|nr:DUF11 domain-containing protein [Deltaproteobacteria bacterium]